MFFLVIAFLCLSVSLVFIYFLFYVFLSAWFSLVCLFLDCILKLRFCASDLHEAIKRFIGVFSLHGSQEKSDSGSFLIVIILPSNRGFRRSVLWSEKLHLILNSGFQIEPRLRQFLILIPDSRLFLSAPSLIYIQEPNGFFPSARNRQFELAQIKNANLIIETFPLCISADLENTLSAYV